MLTIKGFIDEFNKKTNGEGADFHLLKGEFLDLFYSADRCDRILMIHEEPDHNESIDRWVYAFLASMVHKLANDKGLPVPGWVFGDYYYLEQPYFSESITNKNLKLMLMYTSPSEFKHRNVFTSEDTLNRV